MSDNAAKRRERYLKDPEYRARERARARAWYAANREKEAEKRRERYATDVEFREAKKREGRERYENDPQYREAALARGASWRRENADRERARQRAWRDANRERLREANRFYAERKRREAGVPERNWRKGTRTRHPSSAESVDPQPFIAWLDGWLASHPDETIEILCERAGVPSRTLRRIRSGEEGTSFATVDKVLVAAGEPPYMLDELCPFEGLEKAA